MKKTLLLTMFASVLITISSCKKEILGCTDPTSSTYDPEATQDNGSCQYTGNVTFWYNSNGTNATVTINGKVGYITAYYSTYNPTCGSAGCANFSLTPGTYYYNASSTWSTWNGTVTVTKNGCARVLLQ